jgi:hypothetical protein
LGPGFGAFAGGSLRGSIMNNQKQKIDPNIAAITIKNVSMTCTPYQMARSICAGLQQLPVIRWQFP